MGLGDRRGARKTGVQAGTEVLTAKRAGEAQSSLTNSSISHNRIPGCRGQSHEGHYGKSWVCVKPLWAIVPVCAKWNHIAPPKMAECGNT